MDTNFPHSSIEIVPLRDVEGNFLIDKEVECVDHFLSGIFLGCAHAWWTCD